MSERRKGDDGFLLRGRIWWIRTDPITGKQRSTKAKTRAQRDAWYEVRYRQSLDPDYEPEATEDASLNHWALKFVEHKSAFKSVATASFYAKKLGHIVRIFGADTPISVALRPKNFDAYVLQRKEEGARSTTILKEIGAAKTMAKFAARSGAFHGRPELFKPTELGDDYEPGDRFLTPRELVSLLAQLEPHRAAHVALAVAIGCRFSETFRVGPRDVDTERWLVFIRGTKTKRSRALVPVAEPFRPLLLAALPLLPLRRWTNSNMKRDLAKACAKAGIEPVTSNDLRRTHGSWLAEAGVSDEHIGKVLRHADGRMARRVYGQLSPEKLGKLLAAKTGATIPQQLTVSGEAVATESSADSDGSTEGDMRIENPRVGGSIPSRDTSKTACFQGDAGEGACYGVPQDDAKARIVRNDSATVSPDSRTRTPGSRAEDAVNSAKALLDGSHPVHQKHRELLAKAPSPGAGQDPAWHGPSAPPDAAADFSFLQGDLGGAVR